jgi:ABC-2 type transport system ATP-binding protein
VQCPDHAILIKRLSKSFGTRQVLREVDLEVAPGTIVGLLGANGAGKTTLLEILSTLLLPTAGDTLIYGYDVVAEAAEVRRLVGYCPCGFDSFYPRLTGVANLEFFAALSGFSRRAGRTRVNAVFDLLSFNGSRHSDFQKYSAGMKQKLALARALIADPPLILLDEPTKSLDPAAQGDVWTLLRDRLVGELGKTILLVTHSLVEARTICDRVFALEDGGMREVTHGREGLGVLQA